MKNNNNLVIGGALVVGLLLIGAGIFFDSGSGGAGGDVAIAAAESAGVDAAEFESCISSDDGKDAVNADAEDARAAGGNGTPFSVFVLEDPLSSETRDELASQLGENSTVTENGKRISLNGALSYNGMKQIIETVLADPQSDGEVASSSELAIAPVDEDDHIRGDRGAEIVLVEYSDFNCPFCGDFHDTMKQVVENYDSSQVAWVYRHLPVPSIPGHEQSPRYAQGAECASDIGGNDAFWDYADAIFAGN